MSDVTSLCTLFRIKIDGGEQKRQPGSIRQGPDLLLTRKKLRVHQDAVYWIDIRLAHKKGLKFFQTRSNVTIL